MRKDIAYTVSLAGKMDGFICRSVLEARNNTGWFGTAPDKSFTEASWWELTVLPMLAYLTWAIFYYFKVGLGSPQVIKSR